jgi:hypothetical protein
MPSGIYTRTYKNPKGVRTNTGRTHFPKGHVPANKGIKRPGVGGVKKGNTPWNKGKKLNYKVWNAGTKKPKVKVPREQWLRNLSLSHIGKMTGEQNPQWKGGVTPVHNKIRMSVDYKAWVRAVYERDNFTCQKTQQKGGKLVAHHINNFSSHPELRFAIDNGITLSKESHEEFHKKYGKTNNTLEQLQEFLINK